jgi:hypothetical protein
MNEFTAILSALTAYQELKGVPKTVECLQGFILLFIIGPQDKYMIAKHFNICFDIYESRHSSHIAEEGIETLQLAIATAKDFEKVDWNPYTCIRHCLSWPELYVSTRGETRLIILRWIFRAMMVPMSCRVDGVRFLNRIEIWYEENGINRYRNLMEVPAEFALVNGLECSTSLLKLLLDLSPRTISTSRGSTGPKVWLLEAKYVPHRFRGLSCAVVPSASDFGYKSTDSNYSNKLLLAIMTHNNDALKVILTRGGTPYLRLLPTSSPSNGGDRYAEYHEAIRDPWLSLLALALYSLNTEVLQLLCLFHEPKRSNFFELLDFATIDCFFECFVSKWRPCAKRFDIFECVFLRDKDCTSDSSDYSNASEYPRECTYLGNVSRHFYGTVKIRSGDNAAWFRL